MLKSSGRNGSSESLSMLNRATLKPVHAERDTRPGKFSSGLEPSMTPTHTYASAAPNRRGPLGR